VTNDICREILHGVPVATVVRENPIIGGFAVKSGVEFTVRKQPQYVFGFSYAPAAAQLDSAVRSSKFEVLERLFSTPSIHGSKLDHAVAAETWSRPPRAITSTRTSLRDICLQPGADSTGLSIQTDAKAGRAHAVSELLERHLLGCIWYENSINVARLSAELRVYGIFKLAHYTAVAQGKALPLVIAVVTSDRTGEGFVGSAFDEDPAQAKGRATTEALMLLDGHLQNDDGRTNSPRSSKRLKELASSGRDQLKQITATTSSVSREDFGDGDLIDLASSIFAESPIDVAQAEIRPGLFLSRARCKDAVTLPEWRRRRPSQPDPFC